MMSIVAAGVTQEDIAGCGISRYRKKTLPDLTYTGGGHQREQRQGGVGSGGAGPLIRSCSG